MSIYTGIPTETLQANLAEAQAAIQPLSIGKNVVSVGMGDKKVTYYGGDPESLPRLKKYIRDLQVELGIAAPSVPGIYLSGGKGL